MDKKKLTKFTTKKNKKPSVPLVIDRKRNSNMDLDFGILNQLDTNIEVEDISQ